MQITHSSNTNRHEEPGLFICPVEPDDGCEKCFHRFLHHHESTCAYDGDNCKRCVPSKDSENLPEASEKTEAERLLQVRLDYHSGCLVRRADAYDRDFGPKAKSLSDSIRKAAASLEKGNIVDTIRNLAELTPPGDSEVRNALHFVLEISGWRLTND